MLYSNAHRHDFFRPFLLRLFVIVLFLIVLDLLQYFLILLNQKLEHFVKLLRSLDLDFRSVFLFLELLFESHELVYFAVAEGAFGDVLEGDVEELFVLVVKGLARDLDANGEHDLEVDDRFFQGGVEDAEVPFSGFFELGEIFVSGGHYFVQVDFCHHEIVVVEAFEGLQHFLDCLLDLFDQRLVFDLDRVRLAQEEDFLTLALGFTLQNCEEDLFVRELGFELPRFGIDDVFEHVDVFGSREHWPQDLLDCGHEVVFLLRCVLGRILVVLRETRMMIHGLGGSVAAVLCGLLASSDELVDDDDRHLFCVGYEHRESLLVCTR